MLGNLYPVTHDHMTRYRWSSKAQTALLLDVSISKEVRLVSHLKSTLFRAGLWSNRARVT